MRGHSRHLFNSAALAALVLCAGTGCASKLAARGDFIGRAAPVFVQTMDREDHTVYVLVIEHGPMFTDPDVDNGKRGLLPSTDELAVLHKDIRGNAYELDDGLVGRTLRVTGVMRIHGRTLVNGRELRSMGNDKSPYATDYGLQVRRVKPLN